MTAAPSRVNSGFTTTGTDGRPAAARRLSTIGRILGRNSGGRVERITRTASSARCGAMPAKQAWRVSGLPTAVPVVRADGDDGDLDRSDPVHAVREPQALARDSRFDEGIEAWLEERQSPGAQGVEALVIDFDPDDLVTPLRQAGRRDQADITHTKHSNAHAGPLDELPDRLHLPGSTGRAQPVVCASSVLSVGRGTMTKMRMSATPGLRSTRTKVLGRLECYSGRV